jgi:hypothetical protein
MSTRGRGKSKRDMSKARLVLLFIGIGFTIYFGISMISSIGEFFNAEKNLGYEYGVCVFYDRIPLEECNAQAPDGLAAYEKYYGDGSWTVEADPIP